MALNTNHTPNYTLGRGKVYFARFTSGQTPGPFRYIGNTPEFNLTIESETLDHFSSDEGIREKDDSVPLEVTRTGSLVCDDINAENVALFFFGSTQTLTQVQATGQAENFSGVNQEDVFQLGLSLNDRVGTRGVSNVTVESNPASTTYVEGTDYTVDEDLGRITFHSDGEIADDTLVRITYDLEAATWERLKSAFQAGFEVPFRFISDNAAGPNRCRGIVWSGRS